MTSVADAEAAAAVNKGVIADGMNPETACVAAVSCLATVMVT